MVIRVEGLGKKYALHHEKSERYTALRDVVARQAKAAGRLLNPFTLAGQLRKAQREAAQARAETEEDFWALKDVSFEIRRGERVGIIGRNGAGKSTLLKILSRITEPTTGRVEIRGRVASLLEVGTGFHPELTGRENIYLNGAILGMTRREIGSKFDEIVEFAEVDKFLDTPVKRYSSGMYVRLAFAVAANLSQEILVVDEVLAVGDIRFQEKCLGKMDKIAEETNRAVIFVSHQINAISRLCNKCLILKAGRVASDSTNVQDAINEYLDNRDSASSAIWSKQSHQYCSAEITPVLFSIRSSFSHASSNSVFPNNIPLVIDACFDSKVDDVSLNIGVAIYSSSGELLLWSFTSDSHPTLWPSITKGPNHLSLTIPKHFFNEGLYRVEMLASLHMKKWIIHPNEAPEIWFTISGSLSESPHWIQARPGLMAPIWDWRNALEPNLSGI